MILLHGAPSFSGGHLFFALFLLVFGFGLLFVLLLMLPFQIAKKLPKRISIPSNIGVAIIYAFIAFQMGMPLPLASLVGFPALLIAVVIAMSPKDKV